MHGNITPLEAVDFMQKIESRFIDSIPLPLVSFLLYLLSFPLCPLSPSLSPPNHLSPSPQSQHPDRRIVHIPTKKTSVFSRKGLSLKEANSCNYFYLQVGPESVEDNAVADLFAQLLRGLILGFYDYYC